MAGVRLDHIVKRFGDNTVIDDLSLDVCDHKFMVLVGPSGCGKSTVLRMVAGLEEVSAGTISIGDLVVNDVPPKERDVAMVFQSYALYPHMTVRQNLEFGLKIRSTPRAERERLVAEAALMLGLTPYLERKPKQLSGGQRQRVAVGRALVRKPSVFLFDEPLSNLDAKLRVQMRAEIKKLQQRLGTTTIYVTHDQVEAMTMGSRIAVLRDGRLQQVGAPLEVYARPANAFVAQFIGTPPMNFVTGRLADAGSRIVAATYALPVPAALRAATAGRDGLEVLAGIRPEHVFGPGRQACAEEARVEVVVEVVETLGNEVVVHALLGDDAFVYKQARAPEMGSRATVWLDLSALHLFEAKSGARLG